MRLIAKLHVPNHDSHVIYECDTCHGVMIVGEPATHDKTAVPVSCSLCNEMSSLAERFSMALDTLSWAVMKKGGSCHGSKCGFPSMKTIKAYDDVGDTEVAFEYDKWSFIASRRGCGFRIPHDDSGAAFDEETMNDMEERIKELFVLLVIRNLSEQKHPEPDGSGDCR